MKSVSTSKLAELQSKTENIRNICIMAHVDHGKTTLADSLVASNGIISQRLAGKLRYMDSRPDEQERGITMKSSAITLCHRMDEEEFLINLIDSPGHVDFSSEVSTALRLCDGALVVVDVVEGVCAQTVVALRQAWQESIKPVLVLNKMDRLITEIKLTPLDAYVHLTQVLEKVNAVMAELFTKEVMEKDLGVEKAKLETSDKHELNNDVKELYDWNTGMEEADDSQLYFSPDQGNVVFASASDGWGFRIQDFAKIYSSKIGVKEAILNKTLWGDFFLNSKLKRIVKGAQETAKKPLFVQLILENLWSVYEAIIIRKDKVYLEKIITNLHLQIHPRDLRLTDMKSVLYAVTSNWLPLSRAILEMVCEKLPSPLELSESKIERLMSSGTRKYSLLPSASKDLKTAFMKCSRTEDAPVIVFVSKMFSVESKLLPENKPKMLTADEIMERRQQARARFMLSQQEIHPKVLDAPDDQLSCAPSEEKTLLVEDSFIAFARIYSGTLKKGKRLFVLGPRHDPSSALSGANELEYDPASTTLKNLKSGQHFTSAEINKLYLLMGRELEDLNEVPAGCILGIGGLEEHILKTATISSTLACPPFTDINFLAVPILKVALETRHPSDMAALRLGLKLLNQADPCVQMFVQETGEHVLVTSGEIHLQRCLDDLTQRFAKVEITVSEPIVPFRETIVLPPKTDMVNELITQQQALPKHSTNKHEGVIKDENGAKHRDQANQGLVTQRTSDKQSTITIRAVPLPFAVTKVLEESSIVIKSLSDPADADRLECEEFREKLRKAFEVSGWDSYNADRIWSFGPKKCGPNVLINNVDSNSSACIWMRSEPNSDEFKSSNPLYAYNSNFVNGFQLATNAGPLCEEPLRGVAFLVEDWTIEKSDEKTESNSNQPFGPFSGQIMSAVKEACRKAFQVQPQRLMVAMYSSSIQVNSEALGKLYAVVGKRCGRILHGDLQEGSTMFEVTAELPVVESFKFADEVRRQTSGMALPQLVFSHWEVLDIDPFWQPTTEEEYLHFGEKADTENRARKYVNAVRKRKGLHVEEKIVEFAEKQRTLTRNK